MGKSDLAVLRIVLPQTRVARGGTVFGFEGTWPMHRTPQPPVGRCNNILMVGVTANIKKRPRPPGAARILKNSILRGTVFGKK